jgi:hypothetical protein
MPRLLILVLLAAPTSLLAQDFCGHIKYRYTYYKIKGNKDVTSKVDDFKTEDFYICKNNFKVYFDGQLKDIYIGDSLTYFQVGPDTTIRYIKADSAYGQLVPLFTNPKSDVGYNGRLYNTIDSNDEEENTTYYYSKDVRIDTTMFRNLELYHWNSFFNATHGGLRLIGITINKDLKSIGEAVEINRIELHREDFLLPKGYKVLPYTGFEILN